MLLQGVEALKEAHGSGRALCGFSTYNAETTAAIVAAAELTGLPVLLQAGSSAFRYAGLDVLAHAALTAAAHTTARVGVHLDHSRSLEEIAACLRLGYSSVMVDGSHLPFEQNVALTCEAVRLGRAAGAWVEGELGAVAGDEDVSQPTAAGQLTDPAQAEQFVARTGVDALAVAIGNVHGTAGPAPVLDLERLAELAARVEVPLVLHGASGVSDEVLQRAVRGGVAKINVNTELRAAFFAALADGLPASTPGLDLPALLRPVITAVRDVAVSKIETVTRSRSDQRPARAR